MNLSRCVSSIKMSLGLNMITLPFKNDDGKPVPTENVIKEVLTTITIPEYSQFVPWIRTGDCDVEHLQIVDKRRFIYKLPKFLCLTPIMYVVDVSMPMHNLRGTYGDVAPAYGINRSVQGVATSMAYMMLAGQMRAEPTFEYMGNEEIRLYGYPRTMLTFKVAAVHEESGESIPDTCYDSFMELAMLDMKEFLYNNLKLYDGIPTAFGNINMKIDEYQGAAGDKSALLEKWRDTYHLDFTDWYEFM